MKPRTKTETVISWICRITVVVILLHTLFFQFIGEPESLYVFTKVDMEPWGRCGIGILELIASILLVSSCHCWLGAIFSRLIVLGLVVQDDGGLLFGLAITVAICSLVTIVLHRRQIPFVSKRFKP